jgi:uncharacterized protein YjiS (DUF1127 family)
MVNPPNINMVELEETIAQKDNPNFTPTTKSLSVSDDALRRFAPPAYRALTPLSQWQNDMRRRIGEIKQLCDDLLRDIG